MVKEIDFKPIFEAAPSLNLILLPDFTIVAVSDAYLNATMTRREDILDRNIFDVFPDNPDDHSADGVKNLRDSLNRVVEKLVSDAMPIQKYDIRRPPEAGAEFEVRYWSPVNVPVVINGELINIIHRVEDVTEFVRLQQERTELAGSTHAKNNELTSSGWTDRRDARGHLRERCGSRCARHGG